MDYPASISLLTLFAGRRKYFSLWGEWLLGAVLPCSLSVTFVDNSGDTEFAKGIRDFSNRLLARKEILSVSLKSLGKRYEPKPNESYFDLARHSHVAALYQEMLPTLKGDLFFTLEDDVIPPIDALSRMVGEVWVPSKKVGAIAAAYTMPTSKVHITAASKGGLWSSGVIKWDDLPKAPIEVGFTGGGCTLWNPEAVKSSLPVRVYVDNSEGIRGWDNNLSRSITDLGYNIFVHGDIRCDHLSVDHTPKREDG